MLYEKLGARGAARLQRIGILVDREIYRATRSVSNIRDLMRIPIDDSSRLVKGRDRPRCRLNVAVYYVVVRRSMPVGRVGGDSECLYRVSGWSNKRNRRTKERRAARRRREKERETKRDDFRRRFHARGHVGIGSAERNPRHCPLFIVFSSFITPSFVSTVLFPRDRRKRANKRTRPVMKSSCRISIRSKNSSSISRSYDVSSNDDDKGWKRIVRRRFLSLIKSNSFYCSFKNSVTLRTNICI